MQLTMQKNLIKSESVPNKEKAQKPSQWELLVKSLVRPPRMKYSQSQLGNKLIYNELVFNRIDQIVLHKDKKLFLSIFQSMEKNFKLILYLHGNSSSKLQCKTLISYLPPGFSLASFDFLGCGNNMENDMITLGHDQSKQVQTIVSFLRQRHYKVYLWGRSMGAVAALRYGKADIIVADSPFRSMKKLCKQLSSTPVNPLPTVIVNCLFPCVFQKLRSDIKKKGNYDLQQLDTEKSVKNINPLTTIVFISGNEDELVSHKNSEKLFQLFPGQSKYFQLVYGNHNSSRPVQVMKKIMKIIQEKSEKHEIVANDNTTKHIQLFI